MTTTSKALKFIGESLATGAIGEVGGAIAGSILDKILGGNNDSEAIAHLGEQLNQVENMIEVVLQELRKDFSVIEEQLAEIEQEQRYTAWEVRDNDANKYITAINTQYSRYVEYGMNPKSTSKESINNLILEILNTNDGAEVNLNELNTLLIDSGQEKGILHLWQEMVVPLIAKGKMPFNTAVNNYMEYYGTIVLAQMRAALLLVEAFNAKHNQPVAKESWQHYRNLAKRQEIPFVQYLDQFAATEINKYQEPRAEVPIDAVQARQSFSAGSAWGWYRPTHIHQLAETLLANAQSMAPDERRIVVWMVYPADHMWTRESPPKHLDNVDVLIVPASDPQHGQVCKATNSEVIQVRESKWGDIHTIKRFVFKPDDGVYVLKDMNGQNGLPDVPAYDGKKVSFQNSSYLTFTMSVSPAEQFDFMDFAAYSYPTDNSTQWGVSNLPV